MSAQDFQVKIQHDGQKMLTKSFANPGTAREWVWSANDAGAELARVTRKSDGVVILDPANGVDLPVRDWINWEA